MSERIYVVIPEIIQITGTAEERKDVIQPAGRQIAQACHVVSKLRHREKKWPRSSQKAFEPVTTIILQARDSNELYHIYSLLLAENLNPVTFEDTNTEYGDRSWATALAVFASQEDVVGILDYLPLWKVN